MRDLHEHVLRLRDSTAARVALRRGDSTATEHYAYPYLVPLWATQRWVRIPLLRFASLAAAAHRLAHDPDGPGLGGWMRAAAKRDDGRLRSSISRRLVLAQTGDVEKFHQLTRTLLRIDTGPRAINWGDVWRHYRLWDYPEFSVRRDVRRRLLEDFHTPSREGDDDKQGDDGTDGDTAVA